MLVFRHGKEKAVNKDSGEAVSDLAISKGINIDGVDSQTLFSLVRELELLLLLLVTLIPSKKGVSIPEPIFIR